MSRDPARSDLDELLNVLLDFASEMLKKQGTYYPFGATMLQSGEIVLAGAHTGEERPDSNELIKLFTDGMASQASNREIKACGICVDTLSTPDPQVPKSDAVLVMLDHENCEAVNVYLPYRKKFPKRLHFGEMYSSAGTLNIFRS